MVDSEENPDRHSISVVFLKLVRELKQVLM